MGVWRVAGCNSKGGWVGGWERVGVEGGGRWEGGGRGEGEGFTLNPETLNPKP